MESFYSCLLAVLLALTFKSVCCIDFNQNDPVDEELAVYKCPFSGTALYSIESTDPPVAKDYFKIHQTNGSISLKKSGQSIPQGEYAVNAQCFVGSFTDLSSFTFTRKEQNEYAPMFTHSTSLPIDISESRQGNIVLDVNATDEDLGVYGNITYSLSGHQVNTIFSLNKYSGKLTQTGTTFEYSIYNVTITAKTEVDTESSVSHSATATVTATVNYSPVFGKAFYSASEAENQIPSAGFITVSCTDAETPDNQLKYSLEGQNSQYFSISDEGELTSSVEFDYDEGTQFYQFTVVCSDGTETDEATIQIDVQPINEHTPIVTVKKNPSVFYLLEAELTKGYVLASTYLDTAIFKITATDLDAGNDGVLTFDISGLNENVKDFFAINSTSGDFYVSNDFDLDDLGESLVSVGFSIIACDPASQCGNSPTETIVIVGGADELPMFEQSMYYTLKEEADKSVVFTPVLTVVCSDHDHGQGEIDYVEFYDSPSNIGSYISLSSIESDDTITTEVFVPTVLDYESNTSYSFALACYDITKNVAYTNITIDISPVNDLPPVFSEVTYHFNLSRTAPADESYVIGTVVAIDGDIQVGNDVKYGIQSNPYSAYVSINDDGEIILEQSLEDFLDDFIVFQVEATDNNEMHKDVATVFIDIEIGNYESPVFTGGTQVKDVSELEPIGSRILTIFCNDTEEGDNGLVSYEIYGGNAGNAFRMNNITGELSVNNLLILPQGEDRVTYTLSLKCTDHGIPPLSDYGSAIIRVYKADVFHPDIKNETIITFVDEGVPPSHLVATITAEDLDTENLDYYFLLESVPDAFTITTTNNKGEVKVNSVIDRELVSEYSMTVVAEEVPDDVIFGPIKNDSAEMFTYVRDINDNTPDCGLLSDTVEISNKLKVGRTIYQLNCKDDDVGNNGNITYTLANDFDIIDIEINGRIYLQDSLNNSNTSTFYLEVTVSDQGKVEKREIEVTILVVVLSTNDHFPFFTNLPASINVDEDSGTFDPIYTVRADDLDKGLHGVVRFGLLDQPSQPFRLIPNTGELYITQSLDYHDQNSYILNISASDPDYTVYDTLTINVVDINEHTPECASTLFTKSITEGSDPSIVEPIDLGCSDDDQGSNGKIVYSITAGNTDGVFGISDGSVKLNEALDYENEEEYDLDIRVSDSGNPALYTTVTVRVQVLPINEHAPVITKTSFSESIPEGTDIGEVVLTVEASDDDSGVHGDLKYSLDPLQTDFGITDSGKLLVTGDIDRETTSTYSFNVVVKDSGTSPKTSSATIDITILDEDDNSPSFTEDLYTSTVDPGNAVLNSLVVSVNCTDPDYQDNADVSYSILSSDDSEYFSISSDGDITIARSLPVSSIYSFGVQCSGVANPNLTDTAQVSITIIVESNITFDEAVYTLKLPEDTPTGTILTIKASSNSNSTLMYNLIDSPTIFQLSEGSGDLMLVGGLDYESEQSYVLQVEATDSGSPPNSGTVAVNVIVQNVNDESPSFVTMASTIFVTEEESDYASLGTYTCVDNDLGDFGKITYTLSGDDDGYFQLDETSGELLLNNPINYESVQALTLQITCTDGGDPAESDVLIVPVTVTAVNEFAPEFSSDSVMISVDESIPVPSILTIGNELVATDNDESPHNSIFYSIISGNDDNTFFISSTEGSLTLVQKLDYETTTSYKLTVMADDSGGVDSPDYTVLNSTIDVEVVISDANDNTPMLDKNVYVGSLSESSEVEDHVEMVTLICTDEDSGNNGETVLTIVEGNDEGIFEIDNSNGKVVLKKEVDFEKDTFYTLTVRCSDQGSQPKYDDASLTINIEDHSEYGPLFEEQIYEFTVNETVLPGFTVGRVTAVDADAGTTGDILYAADTTGPFAIDSDSGVITVSSPLDYETPPTSFVFNVTAEDSTKEKDVTIVAINIANVDDNTPEFPHASFYGTINENSSPGQSVHFNPAISCSDADDEADDISTTFSLVSTETIPFAIDDKDGSITSNDLLDLETKDRYTFTVYCFDSDVSNTTAIVVIDVEPYNDFTPTFLDTPYETTIPEDISTGTSIFTAEANDNDQVKYDDITFSISSGNDRGDFTIDSISGIIRTDNIIDYEEVTNYTLTIAATNVIPDDDDSGSPSLVAYTEFSINVTDVNDNDPVLTLTSSYVLVTNEPAGFHVTTVSCEDPDSGPFGEVSMSLTGSNAFQFELLSNGTIVTKTLITKNIILQVNCTDMGVPPRYTLEDINVVTDDSNDHFPEFSFDVTTFTIFENHTVGEDIGCVEATDDDGPEKPSGTLTYSLTLQEGEDHFTVNSATGCIYVTTSLDYDDEDSYSYRIKATDGGVPSKSDEALINIVVQNVVFDPPQFSASILARDMTENLPPGALVTKDLTCTDRDDDDVITYSISSGNDDNIFEVNSTTGVVVLAKALDYETNTAHVVILRCNDSSNLYDEAVIAITVGPVNEHTPIIIEKVVSADEESPIGTEITIIDYTDQDDGIDGEVTFEIIGGSLGLFSVINDVLYFNESLDREAGQTIYPVQLRITDKAQLPRSSEGFVNVSLSDINDNTPVPGKSIYVADEVDATADIGYLVETVNCMDADIGDNAEIVYSIEANSLLSVNESSGEVTVKGDLREREQHTIALTITCTDKGIPTLSSSFPIQVPVLDPNLHDPVFIESSYSATLPENYNLSVAFINVTATDQDVGLNGEIEYRLDDDFGNVFYIDAESGEISLLTELDFESDEAYSLKVLAVDGSMDSPLRRTGSVTVSIQVTGINEFTPECKKPIYTTIISEDTTGAVLQLTCDDSDNGIDGEISYSITPGGHSDLFSVNSTGWVSVLASIPPNASIEVYEIFVTVSDEGSPVKEYQVEVNFIYSFENEYSPNFEMDSYATSTSESTLVGTVVLTVSATDADPGLQGDIVYSVEGTNYFRVNPQTGEIYVSEELDYEKDQLVSFIAIASDSDPSEPRSSNVTVSIDVLDVNDNSPTCDKAFYSVEIGSSLALNETVFNVSGLCEDIDGPENSNLTYSIAPKDSFDIKSESGVIFVNGPLEAGTSNALTVTVRDSGSPSLSTDITVSVIVRFDNVEAPQFANQTYNFSVLEDADLLTVVGQVIATDADTSASDLEYTLSSNNFKDIFYIDPQSGDVILTDQLDYESTFQYEIMVKVEDSGNYDGTNKLSDTTTVFINVDNVNDHQPVLNSNGLYGVTVNKTTSINESVLTITCTDSDSPPYADPYIPTSGFTSDIPFKLVELVDEWEVQVSLDLTTLNGSLSYDVNFTCRDQGGEEVIGQVFLSVPDVDAPVFNQSSYEWNLREDAESGETFTLVKATSQDNSNVEYEIVDGNSESLFYIHPNTGVVSLTGSLDFEEKPSYALVIEATDEKQRSSTVLLRVFVIDIDDNVPLIPPSAFLSVEHNKPQGHPVGVVECVDDDYSGGNFSFSFVESSDEFAIDNNGIITLESTLDETPVYVLPVSCYDNSNPAAVSTGIVTIEVIFLNLYEPEFELSTYDISVLEDVQVNSLVANVSATDDDIGNQGEISYSISKGNDDKFYINTETGGISVLTSLDRETKDTYVLTVEAVDGGIVNTTVRKTGTATVTVHILDTNDNAPAFSQQTYLATILVNHTILSDVLQVQCEDADIGNNGEFDYTIQPLHESFVIDTNGTITLAKVQSDETVYNFYAYCTDQGDPALTSSALVTVAVNEVEIGDPEFVNSSYSVTIPEDQQLLDPILTVTATLENEGTEIAYSIISGNTGNKFTVNSNTGEISVIEKLDYNTLSMYTLTVKASTVSFVERSSQVLVSVSVLDVNDNDPIFTPLPFYTGQVDENDDVQTPVVQVVCTDQDSSDVLTYSISGDNPENGDDYFDITDGGLVTVKQNLDYETTSVYTLSVECSDGDNTVEATVRVDVNPVNEFKPVFLQNVYMFSVDENTDIGESIGYVNATDDDAGIDGEITFLIDDPGDLSPVFIDPTTGVILLSNLLDYEETSFYNISVIARDSGGSESYVPVEITVNNLNDEPPVLTPAVTAYDGRVTTDSPVGFFVEYFTCTDEDGGDTTIIITSGNDKGYFELNSFNQLVWNGTSDTLESDIVVTIMLKCTDEADDEDTASIAIVVGEPGVEPPVFTSDEYKYSVEENATIGSQILSVSASPFMSNHTIEYSLFSFDVSLPFVIDSGSGSITLNGTLDYENIDSYIFPVQATDVEGGTIALAEVEITILDVNDNYPTILPSSLNIYVKEDADMDIAYAKFTCSDLDSGENGVTTFAIGNAPADDLFRISMSSGSVYLNNSLDYEETKLHNITIICFDSGSPRLTGSATLIVQVTGVNEHSPTFEEDSYNFETKENSSLSSLVGSVNATDSDDGINGEFHYEIDGGSGSDYFRIDEETGDIFVNDFLNASMSDSLTLVIAAIDNGPPSSLPSTVLVGLDITDINESPYFDQPSYVSSIATDTAMPGDNLGTVTCFDYDLGVNAELKLSISRNDELTNTVSLAGNLVGNGSVSGDIVLNATIEAGSYEVLIDCTDSGTPSLSMTVSFGITVEGVNTAPSFNMPTYGLSLHEDTATDESLLKVTAVDIESETVTYALLGGIGLGTFQIDEDTGVLSLIQSLDYETIQSYKLTVGAIDSDDINPQTGSATIAVTVTNVNDNNPSISPPTFSSTLLEDTYTVAQDLKQFSCQDADGGTTSFSVSPDPPFSISDEGMVSFSGIADYETAKQYTVTITCTDTAIAGGDLPKQSTATLVVSIIPVNFFPPELTSESTFNVSEASEVGDVVLQLTATDPDGRGTISFSTDSHDDVFSLNANTGKLSLADSLDRETIDSYTLTVEISDGDTEQDVSPMTATVEILINVSDVNDNSPTCTSTLETITINADTYNDSLSLYNASCSDYDIGSNSLLVYKIKDGTLPSEGKYKLDSETGQLTFNGTITKASTASVITIVVSDNGDQLLSTPAEIQLILTVITGDEPRFEPNRFSVNISENLAPLTTFFGGDNFITALKNADVPPTFSFSTNTSIFLIDQASGNVLLLVSGVLDYDEGLQQYSLGIQAKVGTETAEAILDVIITDYNDNSPQFTMDIYNGSIIENLDENELKSIVILTVQASDIDSGDNADITFSISSGSDNFEVDPYSGELTAKKTFDRETISVYSIIVEAKDGGSPTQSSIASVSIQVEDENDNPPVFPFEQYRATLADNSKIGTVLETITADDPDTTGSLKYAMIVNEEDSLLTEFIDIDPQTGELKQTDEVPFGHDPIYSFKVTANDILHTDDTNVVLQIATVSSYQFSWIENTPNQTLNIFAFLADNFNISSGAEYNIVAGNMYGHFEVIGNGILTHTVLLDRENTSSYFISVLVNDNVTDENFIVNLLISVTDTNDNSPVFEEDRYQFNISEGHYSIQTIIGGVSAHDNDAQNTENSRVEYSLVYNSGDGVLDARVDIISGAVSVFGTVDREYSEVYTLVVSAEDNGEPKPLSNIVYIDLYVSDVNDNAPQFSVRNLVRYIILFTYGSPSNTEPYRVIAETQFGIEEVDAIEFSDPDSSGTATATLTGTDELTLATLTSPLKIISTRNITHSLNGTIFSITISDGLPLHNEVVEVIVAVTRVVSNSAAPTSTIGVVQPTRSAPATTETSIIDPTIEGAEEFITSALGISIIVVGSVLIFAFVFFLCCLICYCYQRYRFMVDRKNRRPTSVFKRVQGEGKGNQEMKTAYSNYNDIDNLDYPHLAPNDRYHGQLYGEHNVVETEFTDQYPPQVYPHMMYPNPSYYPRGFAPSYDTVSSKLQSDQEYMYEDYEESEHTGSSNQQAFRKGPGPVLDKMLEEFYLGEEMLKEDKKRKGSWWSLNKGTR